MTVDTGYKVYMKLHIRNIARADITEYRWKQELDFRHDWSSSSTRRVNILPNWTDIRQAQPASLLWKYFVTVQLSNN